MGVLFAKWCSNIAVRVDLSRFRLFVVRSVVHQLHVDHLLSGSTEREGLRASEIRVTVINLLIVLISIEARFKFISFVILRSSCSGWDRLGGRCLKCIVF